MEFVEIIKNRRRMCDRYSWSQCNKCPIGKDNNGKLLNCYKFVDSYPEEAEKIIISWTEDNSIKTNREVAAEVLTEKFGDIFDMSTFDCVLLKWDCPNERCSEKIVCNQCEEHDFWDREYKEVPEDAKRN